MKFLKLKIPRWVAEDFYIYLCLYVILAAGYLVPVLGLAAGAAGLAGACLAGGFSSIPLIFFVYSPTPIITFNLPFFSSDNLKGSES